MRAPLSWIREYVTLPSTITAEEIGEALVRVGFEVEEIEYTGQEITGPVLIGKVVSIEEITEFKKAIRWVGLDCGEADIRYVICGANNFERGDLVCVALPGSVLPGGFAISQRETYGKVSNGMIASSKELGLSQEHDGILVIGNTQAAIGSDALALLETNDVIFDIAVNPDRGYALSIRGIAREIASSLSLEFLDPASTVNLADFPLKDGGVGVSIEDVSCASVIYIRTLEDFNAKAPIPMWMRRRIEKCGMRSISLAVDITNYVMLELGQPLHAFDKEKISGSLKIRRAGKDKTLKTLDGQVRQLNAEDLLVADDKQALALAGTMGGEFSEVNTSTTKIAVEAARFDPISIAKNSRRHKLSSEASKRMERGVDSALAEISSARATNLLMQLGGARYVGTSCAGGVQVGAEIDFNPDFPSQLTGASYSHQQVAEKLLLVGCLIANQEASIWKVTPPSWRGDLLAPADLVEEVARLVGFEAIPSLLPPRPVSPGLTQEQRRRRSISAALADQGLVEIQTYPFVSDATMKTLGFQGERAKTFRLLNPMSDDAPNLRVHLTPGLIEAAARNMSRGSRDFGLFEMGLIFRNNVKLSPSPKLPTDRRPSEKEVKELYAAVPTQLMHVGGILVGNSEVPNWQNKSKPYVWSDAVGFAEYILRLCNLDWEIGRSDFAPWHPGRCAELKIGGIAVAHAGELHPRVVAAYGLPDRACAFAVNLSALPAGEIIRPQILATLPVAVQDIALVVDENVAARAVEDALRAGAGDLLESITLFDRYDKLADGKISLAFTLTFRAPDRTLTNAEVSLMREEAVAVAAARTGAVIRSA